MKIYFFQFQHSLFQFFIIYKLICLYYFFIIYFNLISQLIFQFVIQHSILYLNLNLLKFHNIFIFYLFLIYSFIYSFFIYFGQLFPMKINKSDLQKSIFQQTIQNQKIYYSYVNKYQATLTMLKNQRLLIFNTNSGLLYYINQPKNLPFVTQIPKPKNDCADMNISMIKKSADNQLIVLFTMRNQKGQIANMQWNFLLDNNALASAWIKVIQQYKDRKIQQAQAQLDKQKLVKQRKPATSNAFIHNTLGYGLMQVPRKRPLSPEEQSKNINSPKQNDSKHQISPKKQNINTNIQPITQQNINPPLLNTQNNNKPINTNKIPNTNLQGSTGNLIGSNISQPSIINNQPSVPASLLNSRHSNNNQLSPQRNSLNQNDSRLTFKDQVQSIISRNRNYQSNYIANQNRNKQYKSQNDWNLKFLRNQNQQVIIQFQDYAVKQFFSVLKEDRKSNQAIRVYIKNDVMVIVTDARTVEAKKIKAQFRNYHFITQSCKDNFIVGVPLSCLIQFQGLVALVKALIPDQAPKLQVTQQLMLDIKQLQRYTRVKNNVLKKATLYDLSYIYQSTGKKLIYINQLIQYLPVHIEQSFGSGTLRPQHLLDNVNQFMAGGMAHDANRQDLKVLNDALQLVKKNVTLLAKQLSSQDSTFANGLQLKDLMHSRGINLKYLPLLYQQTQNKQVKKYIHTFMVAKVARDNIIENLSQTRLDQTSTLVKQTVQKSIKLLIEGNSNLSNQLWKQIAMNFRKQYNIPMSNHDIVGPFFLNCIMKLIPGTYNLDKVNYKKIMFKDDDILSKGFVVQLFPKVKSYYRYTTQTTQKIMLICKGQKNYQNYETLIQNLSLHTRQIPQSLLSTRMDQSIRQYLAYFTCPSQFEPQSFPHLKLYQPILMQPPTSHSLSITHNYLIWCLQKQKYEQFKLVLEQTLKIIDYWFDVGHVYHCQFYEALSQYYDQTGAIQDSINFVKQSLAVCIRSGGVAGKKTGEKYYLLGQKELKAGRFIQSKQNFLKAKANMQTYNNKTVKYPIVLTKIASLHLSQSDFASCIQYGKQAIQKFEQLQTKRPAHIEKGFYDQYSIKALQIMSRSFEIQNKKNDFYRMVQLATTKYNKTNDARVFIQLTKLCTTAVIFKYGIQKCQTFQSLVQRLLSQQQQGLERISEQDCLNELIKMGSQYNVLQRFMIKFQSIERIVSDINSRRALSNQNKQFVNIVKYIIGLIGEDYVYGLIQQKQVEE